MPQRRHFESFDALRFFAFFKVFIFHLPITHFSIFSSVKAGGGIGVMFFFVLSGFLITYIILEEKEHKGRLNLRYFFMRRVLRIWPLYYLMVLFAFLTPYLLAFIGLGGSSAGYEPNWWVSVTFLENYRMIFTGEYPDVAPLGVMWSLCIEEHFYVLWGISLYLLDRKHIPSLLGISVLVAIGSRGIFWANGWDSLDLLTNLDLFAVGAIPAYGLLLSNSSVSDRVVRLRSRHILLFFILVLIGVGFYPFWEGMIAFVLGPLLLALGFGLVLFLVINRETFVILKSNTWISKWGKYTYGLYVYHTLVITLLWRLWEKWGWGTDSILEAILFTMACFLLSLGVSKASYYVFEQPFLRLKRYFY